MNKKPNIVFILADQLRASSLPMYGETQIDTPNLDSLADNGVKFTNAISSCPVCTPYRSMLLTGCHPQTTGHIINFMRTRHDEISIGDAFSNAGYKTGWVGKWHLHTGSFPEIEGKDYVPEGRDRLGFEYWRGYNFHSQYFDGWVNTDNWQCEQWDGYETDALNRYAFEFIDSTNDNPFCLFVSPHQPHATTFGKYAPKKYYENIPEDLKLPLNVSKEVKDSSIKTYRDYLAMTLALDDMVGQMMDYLDKKGLMDDTILIFTSDHGTQMGAHGWSPWQKRDPYEESLRVPLIVSWPGRLDGGKTSDALMASVDFFPTLCSLSGVSIPRTVEGKDLSSVWLGKENAFEQDSILTMNFTASHDYLVGGEEWRGVRTRTHSYTRWLNGTIELYDLQKDPLQKNNLAGDSKSSKLEKDMKIMLDEKMEERNDRLVPCESYSNWFDSQRRVIRNVYGPLGSPEDFPDWSLLK